MGLANCCNYVEGGLCAWPSQTPEPLDAVAITIANSTSTCVGSFFLLLYKGI